LIPMNKHLESYMSLNETERQIVKTAILAGDSKLTRSVLLLYFPKLSPQEIAVFIRHLRTLSA